MSLGQECHVKAWDIIKDFMGESLKLFTGSALTGTSTLMPEVSSWVTSALADIAEVRDSSDHLVLLWCNLPSQGILSAAKLDFLVSFITNQLEKHKRNGVAIIIHANRAGQFRGPKTVW